MAGLFSRVHAFPARGKTWMAGIKPAMTKARFNLIEKRYRHIAPVLLAPANEIID